MKSNYLINFQLFRLSSDLSEGPSTAEIDVDKFFLLIGRLNTWNWPSTPIRGEARRRLDFCLLFLYLLSPRQIARAAKVNGREMTDFIGHWNTSCGPCVDIYVISPDLSIQFLLLFDFRSRMLPHNRLSILLFNVFPRWCRCRWCPLPPAFP